MNSNTVFFGEALGKAAEILAKGELPGSPEPPLLIRDILGRISIALNFNRSEHPETVTQLENQLAALGKFAASPGVICADDLFDPSVVFQDPSIVQVAVPGTELSARLLDRQVTGQDWLLTPSEGAQRATRSGPPRLVFFGLKGGVGRSTSVAILAYELARAAKRVLLIDLDLESPGLSGLLVPQDRLAPFGVVDWLVEDAVGQGGEVVDQITSVSPLSESLRHEIRVVAAAGSRDVLYLDKLNRVYADIPESGQPRRFSERVRHLVTILEERENPDIVLIDSRAGLHDLGALSVVSLASTALLFGTDTAASWQGYRSLFAHWQSRPQVARAVRERLKMVSALFPETDQAARARSFLERSHILFTETLYDEVSPGAVADSDLFNFDMESSAAPHYPLRIKWNSRFQEFDPLQISKGLFTEDEIRGAYGEFIDGSLQLFDSSEA